ncbi:type VI secretion system secreted protein Hcp [Granulicella aggregans]|uniref:Type VI secretion system secreted protein Hcp n=1 Tax=Granulicella aggregans TaxID=474949 RepID=A0A7W7ZI56_9BACT|nr:type VI secretion system tube protein Hcp [Granulicella aggregans]MBB5060375.1 type VI secretion system secreted protein Hcp [Granulicella aggregans]
MADEGVDYFLKLTGAEGESQHVGHTNEIRVLSWSWGGYSESTVGRTQGSGAGKVTMDPITIVAELDASYTKLAGFLTQGKHITTGTLSAVKQGSNNQDYITIQLNEIFVATMNVSASGQVPIVNLTLTYKSINTQYKTQNQQGNLTTAGTHNYDASTNQTS